MALVGSISGSSGITALTGSLIPGSATNDLGSSSSRWNNIYANYITGSILKTGGGNDFIKAGPNITANYNTLGQWEITGAAGGGGGSGVFTEASSNAAYTTSSIAIGFSAAASSKGSDVFFAVSGSTPGSNVSLFAGPVVATGSFSVKDAGNIVGQITETGVISGSALQSLGNLTVQGNAYLTGTLAVRSNQISGSAGGNIELGSSGDVTVAGDLTVAGNDIKASNGNTNITMTSNTLTEIKGDLQVTGDDIKMSGGTTALTFSGTGDVAVAGDLTVTGNDIVFSAGTGNIANAATSLTIGSGATTLNIGSAAGKVVVPGDLEVQGTTMTVSASNLVIEDPLVGFGFLTGSTPGSSTGDRGFVGGYVGTGNNNVAFGYSLSNSAFVATKTTSDATATTFTVSDLQPIRGSRFQVSGSTAELKGNGSTLQLSGSALDVFAGSSGISFYRDGTLYGDLTGQVGAYNTSNGLRLKAVQNGYASAISGSTVWLNADQGQVYIGRNTGGTPNSGFAITVDPAVAVTLAAKEGEGPSAAPRAMTLTGSSLAFSITNSALGFSFQDNGTEFATVSKLSTASTFKATNDLVLSGTTATVQTQTGNIVLKTLRVSDGVNYNVGPTAYASVISGSYTGGGTDAITLANTARISAINDLVIAASATAGSIVLSGSNAAYLNMGQNVTFQQAGTGFLQFLSSSYALQGVGTSKVAKIDGVQGNGILIDAAAGQKVFLSGSIELGGGADNSVNFRGLVGTSIIPSSDSLYTLGTPSARWQHIYTGDLHLRNERGDYTLIEENDFLSIRFNKNGKRYKFLLERVPELDEPR